MSPAKELATSREILPCSIADLSSNNAELVQENCRRRGSQADVRPLRRSWNTPPRTKQSEVEELNRQANEVSKSIGKAKDAAEREARKAEGRALREANRRGQAELDAIIAEADAILRTIPNLSHPDAPVGADEQANLRNPPRQARAAEVRLQAAGPRRARPSGCDLVDFEGGAKVAGHGFYFLKNDAVLLELALQRYAARRADGRGLHADDHARPGAQRNPARHRLHSPRAGNADLQHRRHAI